MPPTPLGRPGRRSNSSSTTASGGAKLRDPMQIDLTQLPEGQTHIDLELEAPSIGLTRGDVAVSGPLTLGLDLDRRGDEIWIRGEVQLVAVQQCSRCLTDFTESLDLDFDVFCAKVGNPHMTGFRAVEAED